MEREGVLLRKPKPVSLQEVKEKWPLYGKESLDELFDILDKWIDPLFRNPLPSPLLVTETVHDGPLKILRGRMIYSVCGLEKNEAVHAVCIAGPMSGWVIFSDEAKPGRDCKGVFLVPSMFGNINLCGTEQGVRTSGELMLQQLTRQTSVLSCFDYLRRFLAHDVVKRGEFEDNGSGEEEEKGVPVLTTPTTTVVASGSSIREVPISSPVPVPSPAALVPPMTSFISTTSPRKTVVHRRKSANPRSSPVPDLCGGGDQGEQVADSELPKKKRNRTLSPI